MSYLIPITSGNLTSSGTWGVVDSTSLLDSEANNTALTTSLVASSAFTPGAIVIDGIAVKIASVNASPNGTITVDLYNSTGGAQVSGTSVTLNVSDLPTANTTDNQGGWVFFKFSSSVTLLAATNYQVRATTSVSSQVNLYRDSTAGNWSRLLRTTTNAAPTTGDTMVVIGEHTGAGTGNTLTVTQNNTATTSFGPVLVGKRGLLVSGIASSTNYLLRLAGNCTLYNSGTLSLGTNGSAIPANSTSILEFACGSDGQYGLIVRSGGILNGYGSAKTIKTTLDGNVSANATTFTVVDTPTGWLAGDTIAIAPTTRTPTEAEAVTVASIATKTITIGTGGGSGGNSMLNAHGGASGVVAEVINLTLNVKIRSTSSTLMTYINFKDGSVVNLQYVEMYYLGTNTATQRGVEIQNNNGTVNLTNISIHDTEVWGLYLASTGGTVVTINGVVCYNLNTAATASTNGIAAVSTSGAHNLTNLTAILITVPSNGTGISLGDVASTYQNISVSGVTSGATSVGISIGQTSGVGLVFDNITAHSNAGYGILVGAFHCVLTCTNLTAWRNTAAGIRYGSQQFQTTFNGITAFGNGTRNIYINSDHSGIVINNATCNSDSTFTTAGGLEIGNGGGVVQLLNSSFGATVAHTSADIVGLGDKGAQIYAYNTIFNSSTVVANQTSMLPANFLKSHKHGQSATAFRNYYLTGTVINESSIRHTASGYSWKMTPNGANSKLVFPGPTPFDTLKAAVNANAQVTVTLWVYYDGSYNGNMPRLVLLGGIVPGVGSYGTDVTATAPTSSASTWLQLQVQATPTEAGVIEFYVDCDGSAGNVYVDDVTISQ